MPSGNTGIMQHPLPQKPAFLGGSAPSTSQPVSISTLPPPPQAGNSTKTLISSKLRISETFTGNQSEAGPSGCSMCSASDPKYTCPRCRLRTCSLPCSRSHKERFSCSGQRDPSGYVPLKEFTQGEWAGDYSWLEEGRRKVELWGEGIKPDELMGNSGGAGGSVSGASRGGRGGRGGATGRGGNRAPVDSRGRKLKTFGLQMELRRRGVWAEFMPDGMARRKLNQSSWNAKNGTLHLTIQLLISAFLADSVAPQTRSEPVSTNTASPTSVQANSKSTEIPSNLTITHPRVPLALSDPAKTLPSLSSLLPDAMRPTEDKLVFVLPFHPSPARPDPDDIPVMDGEVSKVTKVKRSWFFPLLDPSLPLEQVFKGTAWVEFPTIHVMSKEEWDEGLRAATIGIAPLAQPRKREQEEPERDNGYRRAKQADPPAMEVGGDERQAEQPITQEAKDTVPGIGALGDYGSDEEEEASWENGENGEGDEEVDGAVGQDQSETADSENIEVPLDMLVAMSHAIEADLS